jgi:hypothetical protein
MWDLAVLFKDLAALGWVVKRASGCEQARPLGAGRLRKPMMRLTVSVESVVNIRRPFALCSPY